MKVTIAKDGETEEFECEGIALVAQNGDNTKQFIKGSLNAPGWAAMLNGLSDVFNVIGNKCPAAAILFNANKETDHDES